MKTQILKPTEENIALAAAEIKSGGLVAFATETVYGLGADAFNTDAVKKIFAVKGRPSDNPLIIHFAEISDIQSVGYFDGPALAAAKAFMPGPLTLVVKKKEGVPDLVTGGLDTVAVRIPAAKIALEFLKKCGVPVAAPSANTSGLPSPTAAGHVFDDLNGKIRYILDGGPADVGVESTIIDFSVTPPRLLRLGGIPVSELKKTIRGIEIYNHEGGRPLSPGMKYRHYAPHAAVMVFKNLSQLKEEYEKAALKGLKIMVLGINLNLDASFADFKNNIEIASFNNEKEYAAGLFDRLRYADKIKCDVVLCLLTEGQGLGQAVNNRLLKASGQPDKIQ